MRKLLIPGLLFLLFACGKPAEEVTDNEVPADVSTNPEVLLEKVTEAVLAVNAVSYNFTFDGIFVREDSIDIFANGEVVLQKGFSVEEACVYADYTLTVADEVVSGTVSSDGINTCFIDPASQVFNYGSIADGASRLVQSAPQGIIMVEYLIPDEPYGAELSATGYEMLDQETIDGHLCYVAEVQMPPYTSTWWIDTETYLPRANRISVWGPDGSGMEYTVTLTDLNTDIQPDPTVFQLQCPEGYAAKEYIGSVSVGSPAPLWTLDTPDGGSISLEDLRGKVVVMDFWATWCGPCQQVMPVLQELHETYGDDLMVIGVNTWEQGDPVAFMADNGYTYTLVINGDEVAQEYFVEGIPTFYVIAPDGTVAFHAIGSDPANEEALREILVTLLSE